MAQDPKFLPNGQRSINVPVTRSELRDAEAAVLSAALITEEKRKLLMQFEK